MEQSIFTWHDFHETAIRHDGTYCSFVNFTNFRYSHDSLDLSKSSIDNFLVQDSGHADDLQKVTVETFQSLIGQLASQTDIKVRSCPIMIVSGNTTMIHFLLKLNAWTVF